MMKRLASVLLLMLCVLTGRAQIQTNAGVEYLLNQAKDMSTDFSDLANTYFFADSLASFDVAKGEGMLNWKRYRLAPRQAFNLNGYWPQRLRMLDFPDTQYDNDPNLQIKVTCIDDRTLRVTLLTSPIDRSMKDSDDPMFAKAPTAGKAWLTADNGRSIIYKTAYGQLEIQRYPWRLILRDGQGRLLTRTRALIDNDSTQVKLVPFCFIKRGSDNSRSINPVFLLSPGERLYGCGESFTSLNKVGQKVNLYVTDPQGPETDGMYKPAPFYFSNRGYGIFMHTAAPVTCDFGASYIGAQRLFMGDEKMDFFIFFGEPKDILNEYTNITGKSPMLPLWTFGTWMSRISYFSQKEGLDIAKNLRSHKIPADVIHFDTGWFGVDWQCDYEFSKERFPDPVGMLSTLKKHGFHACLWQLPYFTPKNKLFPELVNQGLAVRDAAGVDELLFAMPSYGENHRDLTEHPLRTLADMIGQEDCVIIGRCGNYIFRERKDLVSVFLSGDLKTRIAAIQEEENLSLQQAQEFVEHVDDCRVAYHKYYTGLTWGNADDYDICLDTTRLGVGDTALVIEQYIRFLSEK